MAAQITSHIEITVERKVNISFDTVPAEPADREYPGAQASIEITYAEWCDTGDSLTDDEFDKHEAQLIEACKQHAEELTR